MSSTTGTANRSRSDVLRPVVRLLLLNLSLTIVLAVLTVVFRQQLVDYQFAHTAGIANDDADTQAVVRKTLMYSTWARPAAALVISLLYLSLLRGLRAGRKRAYIRLHIITFVSLASIIYLLVSSHSPQWVMIEQIVQGAVQLILILTFTRPKVRALFN
jgi:hypothetical protein